MNNFENFIDRLASLSWSPVSIFILLGAGIFLTFRLKFIQFSYSKKAISMLSEEESNDPEQTSGFQALATVLSGTIGTGNVAGVATAIVAGGPGALFWMWMTAISGMAIKFSSSMLANNYREISKDGEITGGPMTVMANALNWPKLGLLFSVFCIFTALTTGALVQTNSIVDAIAYVAPSINLHRFGAGIFIMLATAVVVMGGIKRLSHLATILVPFMAIFYCGAALIIIVYQFKQIPHVLFNVVNSALNFSAFGGAVIGNAIRSGVARGLMASEAGLGTGPITMATANVKHPAEAGLIGMIGPIFDTLLVCSMTGLVLLLSDFQNLNTNLNGSGLIAFSFEKGLGHIHPSLSVLGPWVIAIGLFLFAYTTILTWAYLGSRAAKFISEKHGAKIYQLVFLVAVFAGAIVPLNTVWKLADISNIGMALPNILATLLLSGKVAELWGDYRKKLKN